MKIIFVTNQRSGIDGIEDVMQANTINPTFVFRDEIPDELEMQKGLAQQLLQEYKAKEAKRVLIENIVGPDKVELFIYDDKTSDQISVNDDKRPRLTAVSQYVLAYHTYSTSKLSIREDVDMLKEFREGDSCGFRTLPSKWIKSNQFFQMLKQPLYNKLLGFVSEQRGLFLKVWGLNAQKNYWNPPLNAGLPIIPKKDAIHEGTFMLHDLFHFLFFDPIVTGKENPFEAQVYIATRMMSEAFTLVMADMVGVDHARLSETDYDVTKRKIYPVFRSLNKSINDLETVFNLLYADSAYCLLGDDSEYRKLGVNELALEEFKQKYSIFFTVDFEWNEKNIAFMLEQARNTPSLERYIDALPEEIKRFSTHYVAEKVRGETGELRFDKLFEIFWEQFAEMIKYHEQPSETEFARKALIKYLSGQIKMAFIYAQYSEAKTLVDEFKTTVKKIKESQNHGEIILLGESLIEGINKFIDLLGNNGNLLPHEVVVYKLHVPHFRPIYYSYDKDRDSYPELRETTKRILGKVGRGPDLEQLAKQLVTPELQKTYKEAVIL